MRQLRRIIFLQLIIEIRCQLLTITRSYVLEELPRLSRPACKCYTDSQRYTGSNLLTAAVVPLGYRPLSTLHSSPEIVPWMLVHNQPAFLVARSTKYNSQLSAYGKANP